MGSEEIAYVLRHLLLLEEEAVVACVALDHLELPAGEQAGQLLLLVQGVEEVRVDAQDQGRDLDASRSSYVALY